MKDIFQGAALRQVGINYDYVRDRVDKFKVNKTEDRTNTGFLERLG